MQATHLLKLPYPLNILFAHCYLNIIIISIFKKNNDFVISFDLNQKLILVKTRTKYNLNLDLNQYFFYKLSQNFTLIKK
jgi:hypothetical protein